MPENLYISGINSLANYIHIDNFFFLQQRMHSVNNNVSRAILSCGTQSLGERIIQTFRAILLPFLNNINKLLRQTLRNKK